MYARLPRLKPYLIVLSLSLIVYLPVMMRATAAWTDFGKHIERALNFSTLTDDVLHVLFHTIFMFVHQIAPFLAHTTAALAAILLVMLPVPLMAYALLKRAAGAAVPASILKSLAIALTILAPITIWTDRFMLGYMSPMVYHNPTSVTARLFVIPLSLLALRIFQPGANGSRNQRLYITLLSASVVLLATLAKPSFTFALLPGCCLFAFWRLVRHQYVDWLLLACGFCLPGALMLGLNYLLVYESESGGSGIAFGFLTWMRHWIPTWRIPIQLALSLLFPLAVLALYFERARRHQYLTMCWIIFLASALAAYTLYEEGLRFQDGNFLWGSYNAIFLLMFASLLFLIEQHRRECKSDCGGLTAAGFRVSRRAAIASLAFLLHLLSGMAYYYRFVTAF